MDGLCRIPKLTGHNNYASWKIQMKAFLERENLWVDVVCPRTRNESGDFVQPLPQLNRRALACIRNRVTLKVHFKVLFACKTANNAWGRLAHKFDGDALFKTVMLMKYLRSQLVEFRTPLMYCAHIHATVNELQRFGIRISDEGRGLLLLAGLPEEHHQLIKNMGYFGEPITEKTVKEAILNISAEELPKYEIENQFKNLLDITPDLWIIDSGSSHHITNCRSILQGPRSTFVTAVLAADNKCMSVFGEGSVLLKVKKNDHFHDFFLQDVLLIPNSFVNVLSVSKLIKDGYQVVFLKDGVNILNSDNEHVASAKLVGGFYRLQCRAVSA